MIIRRMLSVVALVVATSIFVVGQNTNTSQTQSATPTPAAKPTPTAPSKQSSTPTAGRSVATPSTGSGTKRNTQPSAETAQTRAVRAAFDALVDGIRRADSKAVMHVYWNSPQLILFNNNGTVTKSWEQVRQNRESLYAKVKEVKLDVRDVNVRPLGPSAAVVTSVWEQSQTAEGQPERATGRLTLVFQKIGNAWKAVHAHTSPDRPDPSRLLPSERTTAPEKTP
jgi:uncharacterized protein (TIGR02246 family)